eukprot:TRINITY_DN15010_c0_g2_i2.p1 TRINITY_DN15010_c0_g2~~TRINITY_DN15010_c0_g2_i2.p1  ORF type:complete len:472 (+),score=58.08 TRINITY_DN15010_c0_g2_i2:56-1417(+)
MRAITVLLATVVALSTGASPPLYNVDLDLQEGERWNQVCGAFKEKIKAWYLEVEGAIKSDGFDFYLTDAEAALNTLPYSGEIRGLAECTGVDPKTAAGVNFVYTLLAAKSLGTTLPWEGIGTIANGPTHLFQSLNYYASKYEQVASLRELVIEVRFMKSGSVLYRGTTIAGLVILWAGQRPDSFGVQGTARRMGSVFSNIAELGIGGVPPGIALRQVLETKTTFSEAVSELSTVDLAANVYFIISGSEQGQGIVVARNYTQPVEAVTYAVGVPVVIDGVENPSSWYIVETNYELSDPTSDPRRGQMVQALNDVGTAQLTFNKLQTILQSANFLTASSVFTVTMSPGQNAYHCEVSDILPNPPPPSSSSSGQGTTFIIILVCGLVVAVIVYFVSQKDHREKLMRIKERLRKERAGTMDRSSAVEATTYSTFDGEKDAAPVQEEGKGRATSPVPV